MSKILTLPVLLLLVASGAGQDVSEYSYAFGKRYASDIPNEKLAKSPSWNMQSDSPPLPVGKAIRLANALKEKLVKDSKDFKWHLMSATLTRLNPWLWENSLELREKCWWSVRYEAHVREGGETGEPNHLIIVVLMDGSVILPTIIDDK